MLSNVAKKDNFCIQVGESLRDVIRLMNRNTKGVAVVMYSGKPVGILTERDIVSILYKGFDLEEKVEKFAKKSLITTRGDRTLGYALNLMLGNNIRRIVVTDEADNFGGIVTQQDLLKFLEEDFYRSTIKVKHVVDRLSNIISVRPDESLKNVIKMLVENNISAVAVVSDGVAEGIITEKDVLQLSSRNVSLEEKACDHMTTPVVSASLDTALVEIVSIMNDKNIRRVVILNDDGEAGNIVTIRDVMRNLEGDYSQFLERKLSNAKEILNLLPEMMIEVLDTGKEQLIVWANERVMSKFGPAIIDTPVTGFIPEENWKDIHANIKKLNKIRNFKLKRDDRIYEISGFMLKMNGDVDGGRIQLIMRDVTADIKLSTTDPLTGIYNRRFINEFLMKEIERSKRLDKNFALVICDIDNFKEINDTYGHISGDVALQALTELITGTVRHLDVVGRYGGDEFMMILPETDKERASQVIERIRHKIEKDDIPIPNGLRVKITVSFGVAVFPEDGYFSDYLLVTADERLYKAKSLGKNRVVAI
jgi:diguanylate cyclase (GGDEF)-like protein